METLAATDRDQAEALKRWWRAYGRWLALVLVIAALTAGVVHFWQERQRALQEEASALYQQALSALAEDRSADVLNGAEALRAEYPDTTYAVLGAFAAARAALNTDQPDVAVDWLNWAVERAEAPALRQLARLRLARARLGQGNAEQALALLGEAPPVGLEGEHAELRGDAYAALDNAEQARAAYREALTRVGPERRQIVEMKLTALGGDPAPAATEGEA